MSASESLVRLALLPVDIAVEMLYLFYFLLMSPIALGLFVLPIAAFSIRRRRSRERNVWDESESPETIDA